jgi:hypothetical protein
MVANRTTIYRDHHDRSLKRAFNIFIDAVAMAHALPEDETLGFSGGWAFGTQVGGWLTADQNCEFGYLEHSLNSKKADLNSRRYRITRKGIEKLTKIGSIIKFKETGIPATVKSISHAGLRFQVEYVENGQTVTKFHPISAFDLTEQTEEFQPQHIKTMNELVSSYQQEIRESRTVNPEYANGAHVAALTSPEATDAAFKSIFGEDDEPEIGVQEPPQNEMIFNRRMPDGAFRDVGEFFDGTVKKPAQNMPENMLSLQEQLDLQISRNGEAQREINKLREQLDAERNRVIAPNEFTTLKNRAADLERQLADAQAQAERAAALERQVEALKKTLSGASAKPADTQPIVNETPAPVPTREIKLNVRADDLNRYAAQGWEIELMQFCGDNLNVVFIRHDPAPTAPQPETVRRDAFADAINDLDMDTDQPTVIEGEIIFPDETPEPVLAENLTFEQALQQYHAGKMTMPEVLAIGDRQAINAGRDAFNRSRAAAPSTARPQFLLKG